MKKLFLATTCAFVLGGAPAISADMPVRMPAKAPVLAAVSTFSWTGCHVGAHVGAGWVAKIFRTENLRLAVLNLPPHP